MHMNKKLRYINEKLKDERSKKVMFVSHCILNENTRYSGGAFCGGVCSVMKSELFESDYGIVQLPCPEQMVWGGVLKRFIWLPFDSKGKPQSILFKLLFPFFIFYTKWQYAKLASKTVSQMKDYLDSGYKIMGLVGIDASPTCGVSKTLDMKKSFEYVSGLSIESLNRETYNKNLYSICLQTGKGIYIKILSNKLNRNGINVKFSAISLEEEMNHSAVHHKN